MDIFPSYSAQNTLCERFESIVLLGSAAEFSLQLW